VTQVTLGLAGSFSHGRVVTELLQPDDLAAGVDFVYQLDGAYWERPVALAFTVSAGADDAVSDVVVQYVDATGAAVVTIETGPAIDANSSALYSLAASYTGAPSWSNNIVNAMLPPVFLQPTWQLLITPAGTFAEGAITAVRYYREKFITGAGGYTPGLTVDEDDLAAQYQIVADTLA